MVTCCNYNTNLTPIIRRTHGLMQVKGIIGFYDIFIPDVTEGTLHIEWISKDGYNFMLVDLKVN